MSLVLLFDGNSFDNFPIRSLKRDTTIVLNSTFNQIDNKKFMKDVIIRGLRLIEVIHPNNLKKLSFINMIIRNVKENEDSLDFEDTPVLYFKNPETPEEMNDYFKLTYMCKNCKDPCIKKGFIVSKNMKPPEYCSDKCIMEYSTKEADFSTGTKVFQVDPSNKDPSVYENLSTAMGSRKGKFSQFSKHKHNDVFIYVKEDKDDKFQESMKKEAVRLQYAERREKYKKQMRQISTRKSNTSAASSSFKKDSRTTSNRTTHICKAVTKKGVACTNKSVKSSDYCGIASHKKQTNDIPVVSL